VKKGALHLAGSASLMEEMMNKRDFLRVSVTAAAALALLPAAQALAAPAPVAKPAGNDLAGNNPADMPAEGAAESQYWRRRRHWRRRRWYRRRWRRW